MRRFSVFVTIALLAGFGIGYFARSAAGMLQRRTHAADLAAIEKAHQEDIEATLTQDPKRLMETSGRRRRWPSIREARLRSASRLLGL